MDLMIVLKSGSKQYVKEIFRDEDGDIVDLQPGKYKPSVKEFDLDELSLYFPEYEFIVEK